MISYLHLWFVINYEDSIRRRYQMEYEAAMRDSIGRLMILTIGLSAYSSTFCREFQELSWMDGKRTPLDGKRLKMYIMSMREVVEAYKKLSC